MFLVKWGSSGDKQLKYHSFAPTDENGQYELDVVAGAGRLSFSNLEGRNSNNVFIPTDPTRGAGKHHFYPVQIPEEGAFVADDLVLARGLIIRGIVRAPGGNPVAHAEIDVRSLSGRAPIPPRITSNENGEYEIQALNPNVEYRLVIAGADGAASKNIQVEAKPWPVDKTRKVTEDIELQPVVCLVGQVTLDGQPFAEMPITLSVGYENEDNTISNFIASSATTDGSGRYRLSGVLPGQRYSIEIEPAIPALAPGWKHQTPFIPLLPADASGELELEEMKLVRLTQSVSGRVVDELGNPVKGASVSADMADHRQLARFGDYPPPWDTTDDEGRFEITHLPAEPIKLMAYRRPKQGNSIRNYVTVKPGLNDRDILIELTANEQ